MYNSVCQNEIGRANHDHMVYDFFGYVFSSLLRIHNIKCSSFGVKNFNLAVFPEKIFQKPEMKFIARKNL